MKESSKTAIFLAIALLLILIAWLVQPTPINDSPESAVGKVLLDKLTDPLDIKSLEITKINPTDGEVQRFQVAEVNGQWAIPSHENYPADAKEQMGRVASSLIGLEVLSVASSATEAAAKGKEKTSEGPVLSAHALYGVVDPTAENAGIGSGAGIKIVCTGADDKNLGQVIIGKEVDGNPGLHYVRIPGQHPVYTVKITTEAMSTRFEDWIEKNLLNIESFDIQKVDVEDYSVDIDEGTRQYRASLNLKYDSQAPAAARWSLDSLKMNREGTVMQMPLSDNQEIAEETLSNMVTALDDLKIVDVRRKPEFLAAPLRESRPLGIEMIRQAPEILEALAQCGFYFAEAESEDPKVRKIAVYSSNGEMSILMKNGVKYTLRFGRLAGLDADAEKKIDDAEKQPNADSENDATVAMRRFLFILTEFDESAIEKPAIEELPEVPAEGEESVIAAAKEKRDAVEKANARLQDFYNAEIETGKKRVLELNKRFADWYYVISEDVFKKIHLGYDSIVKDKQQEIDLNSLDFPDALGGEDHSIVPERELPTLPGQEGAFPVVEPPANAEAGLQEPAAAAPPTEPTEKSPTPGTEQPNPEPGTEPDTEPLPAP